MKRLYLNVTRKGINPIVRKLDAKPVAEEKAKEETIVGGEIKKKPIVLKPSISKKKNNIKFVV